MMRVPSRGREVAAEGAVEVVAVLRTLLVVDLDLGDLAEVADHRERDVGERDADELALAGAPAVALGGEHARSPRVCR